MTSQEPTAYWKKLPPDLACLLAVGSIGKAHLLRVFKTGLPLLPTAGENVPFLADVLKSVLLSAWAEDPLDGALAAEILNLDPEEKWFGPPEREVLQWAAGHYNIPKNLSYFHRLAAKRDTAKIFSFLKRQMEKEPKNNFWLKNLLAACLYEKDQDLANELLDGLDTNNPCLAKQAGDLLYFLDQKDRAKGAYQAMGHTFGRDFQLQLLATMEADQELMAQCLELGPWRTNAALRLHDLKTGADKGRARPEGRTAVLLYSWNKAEDLDATLDSLHRSELGDVHVFCLDNGSTDNTPEVVAAWQDKFGTDRFTPVTLPVNVGAAAARNWLMHLPQVAKYEFAAYLDDDIVLEKDWLSKLGAAVKAYPEAGVWGCKVTDHADRTRIQCADFHLMEPETGWETPLDLSRLAPNPFTFSRLHVETLDMGWFDYMRPCASVTGCCHLFRTDRLMDAGDFSLALSPSQYDDFEHDLRMNSKGLFACYTGHLAIAHKKSTGAACRTDQGQDGNALGNKYKMQAMHPLTEIKQFHDQERELILQDLMRKLTSLERSTDA